MGMAGRDCSLERVGSGAGGEFCGTVESGQAATNEELIPTRAVLIEEQDGFPGRADAGGGAGGLDLHEGDETVDFRL